MPKIIEANLSAEGKKFAIVVSRFNDFITEKLLGGALDALKRSGGNEDQITVVRVPGAFEIPLTAKRIAASGDDRIHISSAGIADAAFEAAGPPDILAPRRTRRGAGRPDRDRESRIASHISNSEGCLTA